jgi:hypothetical protein
MDFSDVADPQSLTYNIKPVKDIYLETLNTIYPQNIDDIDEDVQELDKDKTAYKAARYKALLYVKPEFVDKVIRQLQDEGYEDTDFVMNEKEWNAMHRTVYQVIHSDKYWDYVEGDIASA